MFDECFEKLIGIERGYSNNPNDPGGETKYGVSKRSYPDEDIKNLTLDRAKYLYRRDFWDKLRLDDVGAYSLRVAEIMFEFGVNAGVHWSGVYLQRALNALNRRGTLFSDIKEDGVVGANTLKSLKSYASARGHNGEAVLFKCLNAQVGAYYIDICRKNERLEEFFFGWIDNRVA